MTDRDAELDTILEGARNAGLVETHIDDEGQQIMRLTPKGEQVVETTGAHKVVPLVGPPTAEKLDAAIKEALGT